MEQFPSSCKYLHFGMDWMHKDPQRLRLELNNNECHNNKKKQDQVYSCHRVAYKPASTLLTQHFQEAVGKNKLISFFLILSYPK